MATRAARRQASPLLASSPEGSADIFLSYAHENRDVAKRLAHALTRARGWSVWWDVRLNTGELFNREIERVIARARCVIVLWSHHSVQSDWVVAEVTEGWERGVLVPILIDECQPPLPFRQVQSTDLANWHGSVSSTAFLALVEDVQRIMAKGSAVGTAELAAREHRRRRLQRQRWMRRIGVVAAISTLTAAAWLAIQFRGSASQADAVAAKASQLRQALLADYEQSNRTWWSYVFHYRNHSRQLELGALLAAEAYDIASTPLSEATLADAWALLPWTDKGQQFAWDDWHSSLDFSHDGRFLAGGGGAQGTVIWDVAQDTIVARINHGGLLPKDMRTSSSENRGDQVLDFSPAQHLLATAGPDASARLWNIAGEETARLSHDKPVTAVRFSPDGALLAATDEGGSVVLWDIKSATALRRMNHMQSAEGPEFSPKATYLGTISADGTATIWQVSDGAPVATITHEVDWRGNSVDGIAFSPDETTAVTFGDGLPTVFYAVPGGKELWRDTDGSFAGVVFSNDGAVAVIGGVDLAWWDTSNHNKLFSVEQASISAIRKSDDGRFIGTASTGDNVQVWKFDSGREVKRIPTYRWGPSLAFSPDLKTLGLGGLDEFRDGRILEVVNIAPDNLREAVCNGISANFSRNEWREYFSDKPYRATCPGIDEFEK